MPFGTQFPRKTWDRRGERSSVCLPPYAGILCSDSKHVKNEMPIPQASPSPAPEAELKSSNPDWFDACQRSEQSARLLH